MILDMTWRDLRDTLTFVFAGLGVILRLSDSGTFARALTYNSLPGAWTYDFWIKLPAATFFMSSYRASIRVRIEAMSASRERTFLSVRSQPITLRKSSAASAK